VDRIVAVSDRVNAGIHALALAEINGGSISAKEAARRLHISPTYLAKIMQKLAGCGALAPSRGFGGGYALAKPAEEISCLDVFLMLESKIPHRECFFARAICTTSTCALRVFCEETEAQFRRALDSTTIAAIARSFL
jgi:Rrf2 family protein